VGIRDGCDGGHRCDTGGSDTGSRNASRRSGIGQNSKSGRATNWIRGFG
jgi:hypothetical protein